MTLKQQTEGEKTMKKRPKVVPKVTSVTVNREHYKVEHGTYPRGIGRWCFKIGNEERWFEDDKAILYSEAKSRAIMYAKAVGVSRIKVLS